MNDREFENKVNRDLDKTRKDLIMLWEDGLTGLSRTFEQLTYDAKKQASGAAKHINRSVEHGLSRYNAQVQDVANKFPGRLGKNASRYPWVTVTMSLVFGLLLGAWLRPDRQPAG